MWEKLFMCCTSGAPARVLPVGQMSCLQQEEGVHTQHGTLGERVLSCCRVLRVCVRNPDSGCTVMWRLRAMSIAGRGTATNTPCNHTDRCRV
jgi:hypothetical protein